MRVYPLFTFSLFLNYIFQVLENGDIVEFDTPYCLLQREGSLLTKMVQETGKIESAKLIKMAEESNKMIAGISKESEDLDIDSVNLVQK